MTISKINNLSNVINDSHGFESLFVLFATLIKYNPELSYEETKSSFIELLRFMLENKMIKLAGAYTNEVNLWNGPSEEILQKFSDWYPKENEWNYKTENSTKFFFFDYPFIEWLKEYPIKL